MSLVDGRRYFALFITLCSIVIGSESNRALMFNSDSNSEYGEIELYSDSTYSYFLFKNVSNKLATRNWLNPNIIRFSSTNSQNIYTTKDKNIVYPHTYGLAITNYNNKTRNSVWYNSNLPTRPATLEVNTSAERQWSYLFLLIGGVLLMAVVYTLTIWNAQTVIPLRIHRE